MDTPLQERLAAARLLVLDVDGVLTDGRVVYASFPGDDGVPASTLELQAFDAQDGLGLNLLRGAGVLVAWITGRGNPATERRAKELGVEELFMGARLTKAELLEDIQERHGILPEQTVAMGDDLIDLAMATRAAVLACPAGAHPAVRERADLVTERPGGRGAVRELCDGILAAKGLWDETLERFTH
jgi:3-deoxy-D-manno-octulosonate 8-phosphate phosphatase (KDO 8-P phosphatase)